MNGRVLLACLCAFFVVCGLAMMIGGDKPVNADSITVPVEATVVPVKIDAGSPAPAAPSVIDVAIGGGCCPNGQCGIRQSTATAQRSVTRTVTREAAVESAGEGNARGRRVGRVAAAPLKIVGRLFRRR